jgi:hypothetical protein
VSPVHDPHAPVKRPAHPSARAGRPSADPQARPSLPTPAAVERRQPEPSTPPPEARQPTPVRDRGLGLLIIFTAGVLVMVALISVTAITGSWWLLAAVMVVDLAVTASVLAIIARLMSS